MKDEIKEILNRLDFNEWEVDLYKVPITWSELYNIRDYITNLEQEYEELIDYLNIMVRANNNNMNRFLDYKSRIDKAIDYITSEESINTFTTIESREQWLKVNKQILNILTGDDEE